MKFLSRVVWSEGMHLGPHHFQTQSRYFEDSLWFLTSGLRRNPWGLISLGLDAEAIRNGNAVLRFASGVFPDGLVFDIPDSDPAPTAVSLRDLFAPTDSELLLFLSVPKRKHQGLDCDIGDASATSARYKSVPRSLTDETIAQDEYTVALGNKNLSLCSRAQLTAESISFPIALIRRDGKGGFAVDPDFIPPCLRIGANESLLLLLKRLVESLNERIKTVTRGKRREGQFEVGTSALDVANYWFLHALCSAVPALQQHLDAKRSHPEELYLDLARLAGSLCTFSLESNPADIARYPDFPTYVNTHRITNKITSHLVPKRILDTRDAAACIDHIVKTFSFVGLQEAYPISFRTITTLVGSPSRATERKRVNTPSSDNSVEMTPELEKTIRDNNPIDMAVFHELAKRFRAIREGLAAYLNQTAKTQTTVGRASARRLRAIRLTPRNPQISQTLRLPPPARNRVQDQPTRKRQKTKRHQRSSQNGRRQPRYQTGPPELQDHRKPKPATQHQKRHARQRKELQRPLILHEHEDEPQDPGTIPESAQFRSRSLRPLAISRLHLADRHGQLQRMHGELRLDLEPPGQRRKRF